MTSTATDMYEFFPPKVNNLLFSAAAVETQNRKPLKVKFDQIKT